MGAERARLGEKPAFGLEQIADVVEAAARGARDRVPEHVGGGVGAARHQEGETVHVGQVFPVRQ